MRDGKKGGREKRGLLTRCLRRRSGRKSETTVPEGEVTLTQRTAVNYDSTAVGAAEGLTYNNEPGRTGLEGRLLNVTSAGFRENNVSAFQCNQPPPFLPSNVQVPRHPAVESFVSSSCLLDDESRPAGTRSGRLNDLEIGCITVDVTIRRRGVRDRGRSASLSAVRLWQ